MKKALIILNDSLPQMLMGKSSNLAYILSLFELGFETFAYTLPPANFFPSKLRAVKIGDKNLLQKYKEVNFDLSEKLPLGSLMKNFVETEINLSDFDLVFQRLEPMKSPFPPIGCENFNEILKIIQKTFPDKIINLPIDLGDKKIVQEIDEILGDKKIGIPSIEFSLSDENFPEIFIADKVVLKPQNSAQSVGIFALEKSASGLDLQRLKALSISDLLKVQIYKIKDDLSADNLREIIEILLAAQSLKSDKNNLEKFVIARSASDAAIQNDYGSPRLCKARDDEASQSFDTTSRGEIIKIAHNLYNDKILLQPFLDGVKQGDIRVLLLKNSAQDFYIAGNVFRKNARINDDLNFTTSYISGAAAAVSLDQLTPDEQQDLAQKSQTLVEILNKNLREKYKNSLELGADFILFGDSKTVMLGELNHTCPGLLPVAESLDKKSEKYDGGLFYIKRAILDVLAKQNIL